MPCRKAPNAHMDADNFAVGVPFSYAGGQSPRQLAYHILRVGTVLFEKRNKRRLAERLLDLFSEALRDEPRAAGVDS